MYTAGTVSTTHMYIYFHTPWYCFFWICKATVHMMSYIVCSINIVMFTAMLMREHYVLRVITCTVVYTHVYMYKTMYYSI